MEYAGACDPDGRIVTKAELSSDSRKPTVVRPEFGRGMDDNERGDKVGIDQADALRVELSHFDQLTDFWEFGDRQLGKEFKRCEGHHAIPETAQSQLRNDEGVHHDSAGFQQGRNFLVCGLEMFDPDVRVDEDGSICGSHFRGSLRRGILCRSGMVPPSAASLLAASRRTSCARASRISADFSLTPVYAWALRMRSSSSVTVVRVRFTTPPAPPESSSTVTEERRGMLASFPHNSSII
jgi:hypothetical protein